MEPPLAASVIVNEELAGPLKFGLVPVVPPEPALAVTVKPTVM